MTFNVEGVFLSLFVHGYKTAESRDSLVVAKECLQGQHGFEFQEESQWALKPPTHVKGFVSGKIWAIASVGDNSDVRKVEKQRLDSLLLEEARAKYSEIAGFRAANELKNAHEHQNRGLRVTEAQYIEVTMDYMKNCGIFVTRYDKWFDTAANVLQDDGLRIVSRLSKHVHLLEHPRNW